MCVVFVITSFAVFPPFVSLCYIKCIINMSKIYKQTGFFHAKMSMGNSGHTTPERPDFVGSVLFVQI